MKINKVCLTCMGDGLIEHGLGTRTCYSCKGVGTSDEGEITGGGQTLQERIAVLETKLDDIMDKCEDILDKVDV